MIKKLILTLLSGAALLALVYYLVGMGADDQKRPQRRASAVGVETAPVEIRDLSANRVFIGTLEAENKFDAAFKVGGRVREMVVNLGDCLEKGALIARLDSEEFSQQLAQSQAELDVARASLAEARSRLNAARRNFERAATLREKKVSSAAELEASETEMLTQQAGVKLAEAQIQQREAALRAAEVRMSYTTLRADWQSGPADVCRYVASKHVDEGDTISANTRIVTMVDLSQLNAVINVAERDYALLRAGQSARISVDSLPDKSFTGTVRRLAPIFDSASRQARVEITVPNPESILKSGMFARVQIELGRAEQAVAVPTDAVIQRLDAYGVFVVEDGSARFVPVQRGIEAAGWTQITDLEAGQTVVTLGHHLLSDGTPVTTSGNQPERPERPGRPAQK
jgi:RND family efflux transporter MFP subunit